MRLAEEVHKFTSACERLLATAGNSSRSLTEDEARLVHYYCLELLEKMIPPSIKG